MSQFPKTKMDKEVWDYVSSRSIINIINYIINSKYRISKRLSTWLKEQVIEPQTELILCDSIMDTILLETKMKIKYKSDSDIWEMSEYWQTAEETEDKSTGDCEDGAIFMYIKARESGVPANRLMLMCGEVLLLDGSKGGHCWLAYKSDGNPFGWEFLDWCYYFNPNQIGSRPRYEVTGKDITGGNNKYINLWFAFNEDKSHSELQYVIQR
jgi:hypothetical protein